MNPWGLDPGECPRKGRDTAETVGERFCFRCPAIGLATLLFAGFGSQDILIADSTLHTQERKRAQAAIMNVPNFLYWRKDPRT